MSNRSAARFLCLALLGLSAAACAPTTSPRSAGGGRPDPQVASACRARADDIYNRQNRADLSRRDQRDSPFSSSGNTGITSAGLGERYARDRMVADCIATNRAGGSSAASTGPTFSGPAAQ